MSSPDNSAAAVWGKLLRLPNLFTLPGDIIAGGAWAGTALLSTQAFLSLISVVCIYAAGLLLNDYFDRSVDARERPERPIPSGAVSPGTVLRAGLILIALGICAGFLTNLRTGIAGCAVSILVLLYDSGGKRIPVIGPLLMGLCRGGAVTMGILAMAGQFRPAVWLVPVFSVYYIFAVTLAASRECETGKPGMRLFHPVLPIAVSLAAVPFIFEHTTMVLGGLVFLAYTGLKITAAGRRINISGAPVPPFIGFTLRSYILLQGAWALILFPADSRTPFILLVCVFFFLRVLSELASRKFYGS